MLLKTVMLAAALVLFNPGQRRSQHQESAVVTGTVAYLQRSALPPDAVVTVQLQDVSVQDAPTKVVADVKVPPAGRQVPIPFRILYASGDINPTHTYALRASILTGGMVMFTSTTRYLVITHGAATEVAIIVQPVGADAVLLSSHKNTATLEGTTWKLTELGGNWVVVPPGVEVAVLVLNPDEKRLSGSSGCNRMVGSY